jgi:hypothetical protein
MAVDSATTAADESTDKSTRYSDSSLSAGSRSHDAGYATTTFSELYGSLLSRCRMNPPLLPPVAAFCPTTNKTIRAPALGKEIANLSLHPTLEAALHILNLDLPSAHFLLRHMQCAPAWEGMFLHGILHRVEGDYDNARLWYADVKDTEVFAYAWGRSSDPDSASIAADKGIDAALAFIAEIQSLRETGKGDRDELGAKSLDEIQAVVAFCAKRFGVQKMDDARGAWTRNEGEITDKAEAMVVGGEGWRNF